MPRLIITNGESAVEAIRAAHIEGDLLPWDDVLHDGPVPAGLDLEALSDVRARFISACGWAEEAEARERFRRRDAHLTAAGGYDEVILWFEHDLYDQLQLLQALDWFAGHASPALPVSLICRDVYVGHASPQTLAGHFAERTAVTPAQYALARAAWEAFRAPTPAPLKALLATDTSAVPYLRPALLRLCDEYPAPADGLARSERQILDAVRGGADRPGSLFTAFQAYEEALYLGDASLWQYAHRLTQGPAPLLAPPFRLPAGLAPDPAFLAQHLTLTDAGRAVLEGRQDRIALDGFDRWLGGVHLRPGHVWRWDRAAHQFRQDPYYGPEP